ncbi:hypothetical protein RND81_O091100 [Saponaria officinalis]|uniref:Ribosomal protein L2 n=1 Tax=Saponaria officinalis TaxID=3572 RepID=A0AAW1GK83_SAPOF
MPRKPKGSFARFVHGGVSGPKIRPKGVVDGQQVNISCTTPCWSRGTEKARLAERWLSVSRTQGDPVFQVRRGRENASSQCSSTRRYGAEVTHAILPGKARTTFNKRVPVPETDTGR